MGFCKSNLKLLLLAALLTLIAMGCFPVFVVKERRFPQEAVQACSDFCKGPFKLHYRNDTTSFCECLDGGGGFRSIVVGNMGTLYR